jgi:hypothetical protein
MAGLEAQGSADRRAPGQDRISTNRNVTIVSGHGSGVVTADTINLGPGGMFLATAADFEVGDRFICRIDLGEPYKPVLSGAEVRWIDGECPGVGVQFLDIAEAASSLSGALPTRGLETVRVRLASVGTALQASVVERHGQTMVVELDLPFLEPGTKVDVGPDVAARSATVRAATWVGEPPPPMRIQLELDIEPAPVEIAAERVKAERNRHREHGRPAVRATSKAPAAGEAPSPEPERKRRFWQLPARVSRPRAVAEDLAGAGVAAPPVAAATSAAEDAGHEVSESRSLAANDTGDREDSARAAPEAVVAERDPSTVACEASLDVDEEDGEPLPAGAFDPFCGPLDRILGSAFMLRLYRAVVRAETWIAERVTGPRLKAAGRWCLDRAAAAGRWCLARLGPGAARAWNVVRELRLPRRSKKQSRGEPSSVVRQITDRARRVAAKRGRTIALVLFLSLGAAGIATVGYGLTRSSETEREREAVHQEADQAGWTTGRWEEPEPAEPSNS